MNIITRASVKERIHVEQIIRSQPRMHNSDLVDIVTIPVRKCLGLSMDVYKPVGEVKEPLPIILDVHGGGLIAGRKEQNRNLGIQLARRGYIVFIPDYRLVPETDIFGQISDILDALAVIEAKAAEFGGNIEKLFVTADSAGAFLASMAVASLHHPTEMQPVIRRLERYIPQKVQALRVTAMGFQSGMFYLSAACERNGKNLFAVQSDAEVFIAARFGFNASKLVIIPDVETYESNRHGTVRLAKAETRKPLYVSESFNYARFDVLCQGGHMQWELVDGKLCDYESPNI